MNLKVVSLFLTLLTRYAFDPFLDTCVQESTGQRFCALYDLSWKTATTVSCMSGT